MMFAIEDFIGDYLASRHYAFIDGEIKEHAENILHALAYFINEQKEALSRLVILEKALDKIAGLSIPLQVKKEIPDVLCSFFSYVAQSGRFPEGSHWEDDTVLLKPGFLKKLRDDGSVRGETYKKNYTEVGRNDPCPCGSGLKFKKCCGGLLS